MFVAVAGETDATDMPGAAVPVNPISPVTGVKLFAEVPLFFIFIVTL